MATSYLIGYWLSNEISWIAGCLTGWISKWESKINGTGLWARPVPSKTEMLVA
jgi:hypothetical protein